MQSRGWRGAIGATALIALIALPGTAGAASYYGLQTGDQIESVFYDTALNGGSYTASSGALHVSGIATSLSTTLGDIYTEIYGGMFVFDIDFVSESLTPNGDGTYTFVASFAGAAGNTDVELYAPNCTVPGCSPVNNDPESNGYDPEQDGRLLITGDFTTAILLESIIDPSLTTQTFSLTGNFSVTGGDTQFKQAYGPNGSISLLFGGVDSFDPNLIGNPGDNLDPGAGDTEVFNQDFTFHVKGAVQPTESAPFNPVPEPSSLALTAMGLGWLVRRLRG